MAEHKNEIGRITVKIEVDAEEAIANLKRIQREARKATKALRELTSVQSQVLEVGYHG